MASKLQNTYLSLRDRLILNFLFFGVVIIIIVGVFSYYTAREVLLDRTFDQLTSVKVMKKRQLESFFADRLRDIELLASSKEAEDLLNLIKEYQLSGSTSEDIKRIYGSYIAPYLSARDYYSSFYVAARDETVIKLPTNNFRQGDEQLLSIYYNSALVKLWESFVEGEKLAIIDLEKSKPDRGLFIGIALLTEDKLLGMLVMEISMEAINKIMYENNPYEGLGESGESYLVGNDLLMRSISRFRDNSILNTQVATQGVKLAFQGIDSVAIIDDYRGISVLSSFCMVGIPALEWVILAEIDLAEALVPLNAIRNNILVISSFIILGLFIAAFFLSGRIISPLIRLKNAAEKIGQGDFYTVEDTGLKNEIGDLTHSFNAMTLKLSEKTVELERERAKRLRSVIDGQEIERQRLSRELHDGLGQRIIALKLKLENINTSEQCDTMGMIKDVKANFDDTIDEIGRMSNNLMPAVLYEFGLATALRTLMDSISEGLELRSYFTAHGKFDDLDKTTKTYLYRIAQEAVNNAIKHSGASTITLELKRNNSEVLLKIIDNGNGFDIEKESVISGNGVYNMRERTGLLNGRFELNAEHGIGTTILVKIPLEK